MHSFVQDSWSFINNEKLHLASLVTGTVTKKPPLARWVAVSDPYLHLPWHHDAEQHQYSPCTLYFRIFFSKHLAMQSVSISAGEHWFPVQSLLCDNCMNHQLHYPLSPDPTSNVFPNLISLQYFQLGYFYFFSCPVKSERLLCWRKCVTPAVLDEWSMHLT